jgi:hypothetical protein
MYTLLKKTLDTACDVGMNFNDLKIRMLKGHKMRGIVRSATRCQYCILGWLYFAYLRLEYENMTRNLPLPPPAS